MDYYWVRIFDYAKETNTENIPKDYYSLDYWNKENKGTMLDEYYLCGESMTRESAKQQVVERSGVIKFAKPKKEDSGIYAILMASEKCWYDRFTTVLKPGTFCFNDECHKPISGKAKDFPKAHINSDIGAGGEEEVYFYCSYECSRVSYNKTRGYEGEFQSREGYESNGGVYGYIYHIYNRNTNLHYIGQTKYMPFFRWQEHAKSNVKGDICDLIFETICEVRVKSDKYLNGVEAWWIRKFIEDYGKEKVMNISAPKVTVESLVDAYQRMILGQTKLELAN